MRKRKKRFPVVAFAGLGLVVLVVRWRRRNPRAWSWDRRISPRVSCTGLVPTIWAGTLFAMIWSGGRVSLAIGFLGALVSGIVGIVVGTTCAFSSSKVDALLCKGMEIVLSVPSLLLVVLIQSLGGEGSVWSLALVIGLTSWIPLALVVRAEVQTLRREPFVQAAWAMGAGPFYLLRKHLFPNFFPSIAYMLVMSVRDAIVFEPTLSFMGLGIGFERVSWGSLLSMADQAFLAGTWWMIVVPGVFLVLVMTCLSDLGEFMRRRWNV